MSALGGRRHRSAIPGTAMTSPLVADAECAAGIHAVSSGGKRATEIARSFNVDGATIYRGLARQWTPLVLGASRPLRG